MGQENYVSDQQVAGVPVKPGVGILRRIKNWIGNKLREDDCMSCGDSFLWKKQILHCGYIWAQLEPSPEMPYGGMGMHMSIILCEECVQKQTIILDPEKVLKPYQPFVNRNPSSRQDWQKLVETMRKHNFSLNAMQEEQDRLIKMWGEMTKDHFSDWTAET